MEYTEIEHATVDTLMQQSVEEPAGETREQMLLTWEVILEMHIAKAKSKGTEIGTLHNWDRGKADMISVFNGPSTTMEQLARGMGISTMPPIDRTAEVPYDILSDVHFASLMADVLKQQLR